MSLNGGSGSAKGGNGSDSKIAASTFLVLNWAIKGFNVLAVMHIDVYG